MKKFFCWLGLHWYRVEWSFNTRGMRWDGEKMTEADGRHGVKSCAWCHKRVPL